LENRLGISSEDLGLDLEMDIFFRQPLSWTKLISSFVSELKKIFRLLTFAPTKSCILFRARGVGIKGVAGVLSWG